MCGGESGNGKGKCMEWKLSSCSSSSIDCIIKCPDALHFSHILCTGFCRLLLGVSLRVQCALVLNDCTRVWVCKCIFLSFPFPSLAFLSRTFVSVCFFSILFYFCVCFVLFVYLILYVFELFVVLFFIFIFILFISCYIANILPLHCTLRTLYFTRHSSRWQATTTIQYNYYNSDSDNNKQHLLLPSDNNRDHRLRRQDVEENDNENDDIGDNSYGVKDDRTYI